MPARIQIALAAIATVIGCPGLDAALAQQPAMALPVTDCQFDPSKAADVPAWVREQAESCVTNPSKVFAADEAQTGEFPWQASVGSLYGFTPFSGHNCGGTIYRDHWIITARHCVADFKRSDLTVSVGSVVLHDGLRRYAVDEVLLPEPVEGVPADIALLKVAAADSTDFDGVSILNLASAADEAAAHVAETVMKIAGWGRRILSQRASQSLGYAKVSLWDRTRCASAAYLDWDYPANLICAGAWDQPQQQACSGDSGGGLTAGTGGAAMLYGVLAGGRACTGNLSQPDLYTRVSLYRDWIETCTSDSTSCIAERR